MIYLQGKGKKEKRKKQLKGRINNQIMGVKGLRMGVWVERNFIFSSQVCVMYYTTLLRNIVGKNVKVYASFQKVMWVAFRWLSLPSVFQGNLRNIMVRTSHWGGLINLISRYPGYLLRLCVERRLVTGHLTFGMVFGCMAAPEYPR